MTQKLLFKKLLVFSLLIVHRANCEIKFSGGSKGSIDLTQGSAVLTLHTNIPDFEGHLKVPSGNTTAVVDGATGTEVITFNQGSIDQNGTHNNLSGDFNPHTSSLTPAAGQSSFVSSSGGLIPTLNLSGSTTTLNFGVGSSLGNPLALGGATLVLGKNLTLSEQGVIVGPGTVDLNFCTLDSACAVPWASNLKFLRALDFRLSAPVTTLSGGWTFLTNNGATGSYLKGSDNALVLSGSGKLNVGGVGGGHTLYVSDLTIRGFVNSHSNLDSVSNSQFDSFPNVQPASAALADVAYAAGFVAINDTNTSVFAAESISVCDSLGAGSLVIYAADVNLNIFSRTLSSGPSSNVPLPTASNAFDIDAGVDGTLVWLDQSFHAIEMTTSSGVLSTIGTFLSGGIGVADANNIYATIPDPNSGARTTLSKYSGAGQTWTNKWATGYFNILDFAPTTDGYVFILEDSGSGVGGIYKTNGGDRSTAVFIAPPEALTQVGVGGIPNNAICVKGSSTNFKAALCGGSGTVYTTTDMANFASVGNVGAGGVAIGANGALAFCGVRDSSTPWASTGFPVFVQSLVPETGFNVYNGAGVPANRGHLVMSDVTLELPGDYTLSGELLFQGTGGESFINGNGYTLTLSGLDQIKVGGVGAGHTLHLSNLTLNGLSHPIYTVPSALTKSQFDALSGLSSGAVSGGDAAYGAGFCTISDQTPSSTFGLIAFDGIALYDDPTYAAPLLYGLNKIPQPESINIRATSGLITNSWNSASDIDVGIDGIAVLVDSVNHVARFYDAAYSNSAVSATGGLRDNSGNAHKITIGDLNNIYTVGFTDNTAVSKFLGTNNNWDDAWATGYTNIVDLAASNDGYVWILDNLGSGNYGLYKTNGGAKSGATVITLPEAPTVAGTSQPGINAIALKGSSSSLYAAYCGTSGKVYTSTDGINFTLMGNFRATGVAIGAKGTLAFTGADDSSTAWFNVGRAVFVKTPSINAFDLYDGGSTPSDTGILAFSDVTINLSDNYTHSSGEILFNGAPSTIVTGGTKTFSIASPSNPVVIDGTTVIYDNGSGPDVNPFANSTSAPTVANSGVLESITVASAGGGSGGSGGGYVNVTVDANANNGAVFGGAPLTQNYTLIGTAGSNSGQFNVTNGTNALSQTVTIDGGNNSWQFPGVGTTPVLLIADNVTLTLKNVVLKDFSLSNVSFGGSNAGLVFGDGCVLELSSNQSLSLGQGGYTFAGNATIRGQNQTLTLTDSNSITQTAAGATLALENLILNSQAVNSFACTNPTAFIFLYNCDLQIDQHGFNWAAGNFGVAGYTKISSVRGDSTGAIAQFQFTTAGLLIITNGATLEIGRSIYFTYNPNTTNDSGGATGAAAKRHFSIAFSSDRSGTLFCNNCVIDSTSAPLAFDYGNLIISNQVTFVGPSGSAAYSELGTSLLIEILTASTLTLDGAVVYTNI